MVNDCCGMRQIMSCARPRPSLAVHTVPDLAQNLLHTINSRLFADLFVCFIKTPVKLESCSYYRIAPSYSTVGFW